jgi:hypothetical protein
MDASTFLFFRLILYRFSYSTLLVSTITVVNPYVAIIGNIYKTPHLQVISCSPSTYNIFHLYIFTIVRIRKITVLKSIFDTHFWCTLLAARFVNIIIIPTRKLLPKSGNATNFKSFVLYIYIYIIKRNTRPYT